jgi:hypothetical protein
MVLPRLAYNGPLYRGWIYVTITAVFLLLVASVRRRVPFACLVLATSGLLYAAAYFVLAISCDFRYLWWTVAATILLPLSVWPNGETSGDGRPGRQQQNPPGGPLTRATAAPRVEREAASSA